MTLPQRPNQRRSLDFVSEADQQPAHPDPDGSRRPHLRVPCVVVEPSLSGARRSRARRGDRPPGQAADYRQRQWFRADQLRGP